MYDPSDPAKLLKTGLDAAPGQVHDVSRLSDGRAIMGDARNDDQLIICQLHIAFMKFHNALVDDLRARSTQAAPVIFAKAQNLTQWHYQWLVLHDYLPRLVWQSMLDQIITARGDLPAKIRLDFHKPKIGINQ